MRPEAGERDDAALPDVVGHAVQDTFPAGRREAGSYRGGGDVAAFIWGIGWRHIGEQRRAGAELVTPTAEDSYLLLSHAAGA